MPMTILLPQEKILSGREEGKKVRDKIHLDEFDCSKESHICILVSVVTYSINASFFIGCFMDSIDRLGGRRSFEEKYKFFGDRKHFSGMIDDGISRCEGILRMRRNESVTITADKLSRYFCI